VKAYIKKVKILVCVAIALAIALFINAKFSKQEASKDELKAFISVIEKKQAHFDSFKLNVRVKSFELSKATYKNLLAEISKIDHFDTSKNEEFFMNILGDSKITKYSKYSLNYSKEMYRLTNFYGRNNIYEYSLSTEKALKDNVAYMYSHFEETLKRSKNEYSHFSLLEEYGIDILLMSFEGLMNAGRKIYIDKQDDKYSLQISTKTNEYSNFILKDNLIYITDIHAKFSNSEMYYFLLNYKLWKVSEGVNVYIPQIKITIEKNADAILATFYFVDLWESISDEELESSLNDFLKTYLDEENKIIRIIDDF